MRAQTKSLNRDILNIVANKTTQRRLAVDIPRSGVAEIYSLNKQFNRAVLNRLEACDSIGLVALNVVLWKSGTPEDDCLALHPKIFAALCHHKGHVFTNVYFRQRLEDADVGIYKLTGIETLDMREIWIYEPNADKVRQLTTQVSHILEDNKNTLKVLLGVWKELFELLPSGLRLDEFSPAGSVESKDVKIPALDTKLFKYHPNSGLVPWNSANTTSLSFMGTINADAIHLEFFRLRNIPHDPSITFARNTRVKKLSMTFWQVDGCDFARMFREVAACCPSLEHFELLHERNFHHTFGTDVEEDDDGDYDDFRWHIDNVVGRYERVLRETDVPYKIHLKVAVRYHERDDVVAPPPVATDFTCGLIKSDLPCTEDWTNGTGYSRFVKQASFGRNLFDVHCDVQLCVASSGYDDDRNSGE